MNYLKLFDNYLVSDPSFKSNIEFICERYGIRNYTINSDGSIDVDDIRRNGYKIRISH